jgi:hypothetical protein
MEAAWTASGGGTNGGTSEAPISAADIQLDGVLGVLAPRGWTQTQKAIEANVRLPHE